MGRVKLSYAVLMAALFLPTALYAQAKPSQNGVWLSAGVGAGWARVACGICAVERRLGPTGYLRVGSNVRNGLLLGAEANLWTRSEGDDDRDWVGNVGAVGYLYPRAEGPLYFKAGVGYMQFQSSENEGNGDSTGSVGVQLGAGYEFRIAPGLHLTNYVNLLASAFGSLRGDNAQVVDDVGVTLLQIGIGLTRR
jgi:outer membrane protein with beta-barrel domain